jgi:hypothetical protein
MNSMSEQDPARRLVVCYAFPPYADTAAVVAAKRVRVTGEPVDVIYNRLDKIRTLDPDTVEIAAPYVRRSFAVDAAPAFGSWRSIAEFADRGFRAAVTWERAQGPYESMYSRAQFAASHFLAARIKERRPDLRWEAEFSDPLSRDVVGNTRESPAVSCELIASLDAAIRRAGFRPPEGLNAFEWCETAAFALADTLIFTNELQRSYMLSYCRDPELAERALTVSVVSPHPALDRAFYKMAVPDYEVSETRLNVGYFGNFYQNRAISDVLTALEILPRATRHKVILHVFCSDPDKFAAEIRSRALDDCVAVNPFAPYLEFLALCDQMDLLLVNDAASVGGGVNPFLPSKWSDYRGSTTAVWGMVEEDSVLASQPLAHRSPINHATAAAAVLAKAVASSTDREFSVTSR